MQTFGRYTGNIVAITVEQMRMVDYLMENKYGQQIIIRQCSEPTEAVKEIYSALQYKLQPFTRKKSVVPLPEFENFETQQNRGISSS